MGNKARIAGYTRREIKSIALEIILSHMDKYVIDNFYGEGIGAIYDPDVAKQIEKEILQIRADLMRKLFRAKTGKANGKIYVSGKWGNALVDIVNYG